MAAGDGERSSERSSERLSGRVAIITGTGISQGRAAAMALAREGASVVAVDADADAAGATVVDVRAVAEEAGDTTGTGGATDAGRPRVAAFVGDPDCPADAEALVEMVAEIFPEP